VFGACSCGTWGAAGMILKAGASGGAPTASSERTIGGRMFRPRPASHDHSPASALSHLATLGARRSRACASASQAGGETPPDRSEKTICGPGRAFRSGCACLNSGARNRPGASRKFGDPPARPLAFEAAPVWRGEGFAPGSENARAAIGEDQSRCEAGMTDRHLQAQDEAAIAIAENQRTWVAGPRLTLTRVHQSGSATAARAHRTTGLRGRAKPCNSGTMDAETTFQFPARGASGKAGAVRQQRVKQAQAAARGPLPPALTVPPAKKGRSMLFPISQPDDPERQLLPIG